MLGGIGQSKILAASRVNDNICGKCCFSFGEDALFVPLLLYFIVYREQEETSGSP